MMKRDGGRGWSKDDFLLLLSLGHATMDPARRINLRMESLLPLSQ